MEGKFDDGRMRAKRAKNFNEEGDQCHHGGIQNFSDGGQVLMGDDPWMGAPYPPIVGIPEILNVNGCKK